MLVWGAVVTAKELGVSELIIGLTIVAIGTSLPELGCHYCQCNARTHGYRIGQHHRLQPV